MPRGMHYTVGFGIAVSVEFPTRTRISKRFCLYLFVSLLLTGNAHHYSCSYLLYLLVWKWSWWYVSQILAQVPPPHFCPCHLTHFLSLLSPDDLKNILLVLLDRKNAISFFPTMHPYPKLLLHLQHLETCIFITWTFRIVLTYQQFSHLQNAVMQYLHRRTVLKCVFVHYLFFTLRSLLLSQFPLNQCFFS